MDNKELTSAQRARRKYEEKNKEERDLRMQFATTMPRKSYDKINAFLEKHNISKIDLIYAGFDALVEKYEMPKQEKK